jgi:hypothetical protein
LYSLLNCFLILDKEVIVEDYIQNLSEILNWLVEMYKNDSDDDCKKLAASVLNVLNEKLTTFHE